MASGENDSKNPSDTEKPKRVDEIAEAYLKSLHKRPDSTSLREIVDQHPDLAPDLERRLRFIESVFRALQSDSSAAAAAGDEADLAVPSLSPSRDDPRSGDGDGILNDRVVSVRCPHCGNMLKVVSQGPVEVTCGSCGSAVSVDPNATRTDAQSRTPKFIAHFKILGKLGQGAFGTAYKAEDTRLGRTVAVKIPRAGSFATANDELRFVREARHAAQLRHPNIVQVHEIATDHGIPYLVSDFIDGITLADLISGRRLSFRESAEMIVAIAEAVQFAHAHNVIHRDLKPSNVLLDANRKPYITDFGLARQSEGEFTITLEGEVLGTPAYMSPEQASGKDVDPRADIYSLGVIFYRLVCGELPFRGSQRMMIHQVLHDDPRPPRRLDERIPRDVDTIILKAMAKERDRRYASAADFAADVLRWLQSQPITARPVGIVGKSIRWCRRNPSGTLVIAGTSALLLTIAGISAAWAFRERAVRDVMIESAKNRVEALRRLVGAHEQNGLERLKAGDSFGASSWFSKALTAESDAVVDPSDALVAADMDRQRFRIGMIHQSLPKLLQVWPSAGKVTRLEFNADGRTLLATSQAGVVQAINPDLDEPVVLQAENGSEIWNSDLDPSGTRACTATLENHADLWDVTNKTRIARLPHDARVWSANFSPDGKSIATAGADHNAGVWKSEDGSLIDKFEHSGKYISFAKFSPDSQTLLTVSTEPEQPIELRLWDIAGKKLRTAIFQCPAQVNDIAFDNSGNRIYAACEDGTVVIWNAQSGEVDGDPLRHDASLGRLRFVDDGHTLITVTREGKIAFWDLRKKFRKEVNIQSLSAVNDVAVDPRGNFLAIANNDKRARVFWKYCAEPACPEIPLGGHALAVAFHPDGRRLAVGGDDGVVRLWDLAGLAPRHDAIRTSAEITALHYSHDGKRLLVADRARTASQWDATTLRPIGEPMKHEDEVIYCEYDSANELVVTASSDNTAQVWNANTGQPVGPRWKHESPVLRARFVPETDRVITTTLDGNGAIWTVGSDKPLHQFSQDSRLVGLRIHPNGKWFALSGESPFLQIRSTEDGKPLGERINHLGLVGDAEFSSTGKHLVSVSFDEGSVVVTELNDHKFPETRWKLGTSIFACQFGRTDDDVITADGAGELILWSREGSGFVPQWSAVDPAVSVDRVSIHPKLPLVIVSARKSGESFRPGVSSIRFHDLVAGSLLAELHGHLRPIHNVNINPDGKQFATGSADGTVRVWDITSDERSPEILQRLAFFYEGKSGGAGLETNSLAPQAQVDEFAALRMLYPETFRCSDDEIRRWEEEVQWVREQAIPGSGQAVSRIKN